MKEAINWWKNLREAPNKEDVIMREYAIPNQRLLKKESLINSFKNAMHINAGSMNVVRV